MKRFPTLFAILLIFSISIHVGHVQNAVANEADWMPDANLRTAVRSALNLNNNDTLTQAGMANLTGLTARNAQISSLTGLEHATNLQKLDLRDNTISNISALSGLTNLESLKLKGNNISSVSALSGLTNLTLLNLKENNISSISTLSGLTNLEHLRVDANSITDVQPLTSLVNLERLWIAGNSLTNAHLLSSLTGLTQIDIPIPDPPDTTAPSVTVSVPSGTQNGTFDATITFSETVSGFTQSDVSLSGSAASITSWRANSGNTVYTATITPTASGTVTIGVAANVATDAANNQNTAATSKSVTVSVDTTSPDVTVSVPSGVQNGAFSATITFTESVSNFVQSDVSLRGSAASITSWRANSGNTVYTATITPTASGTVTIGVTANVATDAANNQNTAATSKTVSVDVDKPSVTIGVPSGTQTSAFNATITFTESVSNFVQSDVSLRGSAASITSWRANSSNTIYTATITLTASGTVTIGVAANVATDAANNANTAATSKTVTVNIPDPIPDPSTWMPDANLRTAVRSALSLGNNDTLTQAGMANLTRLTARNAQISSLTGLEHATNLTSLDLRDNTISNISALSGLTDLESLKLKGNNISSVSALSGLTNLTLLNLKENNISSISDLSGLTNLEHLRVDANSITDVQPLTSLVNLERLWIVGNSLTNAHLLSSLTGLTYIDIPIPDPPDTTAPSVTVSVPSGTQNGAFSVTITFTESVSNFVQSDVSLRGRAASITSWRANSGNTVYTATITPTASGTVAIGVAANVATDAANNSNTAATSKTVSIDVDKPTATIGVPSGTQTNAFNATITFSETVSGFTQSDVSLSGSAASITSWRANSGNTVYTATITATASGTVTIGVAANVATDAANNTNTAATSKTVTILTVTILVVQVQQVDTTSPGVSILVPSDTQMGAFDVTIEFTETVSGFVGSEVSLSGSAASITSWRANSDNTVYTATITPTASGTVTIGVAANVATDAANNQNTAATTQTVTVDLDPPSVTLTLLSEVEHNRIDVQITFNEPVEGFESTDLSITTNGLTQLTTTAPPPIVSITGWTPSQDKTTHTVYITTYTNTKGQVIINVPADVATDIAGNPNVAGSALSVDEEPELYLFISTVVDSSNGCPSYEGNEDGSIDSIDLRDYLDVNGDGSIDEDDVALVEAALGQFGDGIVNSRTDINCDNTVDNDDLALVDDTESPTFRISAPRDTQSGAFDIRIISSEPVFDFDGTDISLVDSTAMATATMKSFSYGDHDSTVTYSFTITPTTSGDLVISIPAGAAKDALDNQNTASAKHTVTVDMSIPSVSITSTRVEPSVFKIIITFSEAVSGFEQADLSVSGGAGASITAWETTDNTTFTATVTATTNGSVYFYVPAGVATDADGKSNTASNLYSILIDLDPPTVEVSVPTDAQSGVFDVTITFSEKVYNFEQADVSLADGTAAATITDWTIKYPHSAAYRTTYEATITPTTSGTVVITIPADVATDWLGNGNTASASHSITVSLPGSRRAPASLSGIILDPTVLKTLDPEVLEAHLDILRAGNDGSLKYLQAIALLESVLAEMRPEKTVLLANYPNPFNPETWIPYHLAKDTFVVLTIYDGSGRVVRTLEVGHQTAAVYESRSKAVYWDGRNGLGEQVASGLYFYALTAGDYSATRKMLVLK